MISLETHLKVQIFRSLFPHNIHFQLSNCTTDPQPDYVQNLEMIGQLTWLSNKLRNFTRFQFWWVSKGCPLLELPAVCVKMQNDNICSIFKGLRPVVEGVCCHNAQGRVQNRKSNPEDFSPKDLTYCSHKPECIVTTNPDRSILITIITWHFQFHHMNVGNIHGKGAYVLEAKPFHALLPLLRHVVFLNDGNCRLIIPVIKGCCAHEVLPHAFNIGVFKYGKSNSTTIKHIYNESENLNESCGVAFDSNN